MGTYVVKLPDVGEGIAEAELVEWHVAVGDVITEDQPIADVMTDKATVELPSPVAGTIAKLGAEAGDVVAIGSDLVWIDTDGGSGRRHGDGAGKRAGSRTDARSRACRNGRETARTINRNRPSRRRAARLAPLCAAPAVRRRAGDLGIDLTSLTGSGPDGRVVHGDLDRLLAERRSPATSSPTQPTPAGDDVEAVKVIGLRRNIAQRMQESTRRIPHFTYVEEVDVTDVERLRAELNRQHEGARPRLTLLPAAACELSSSPSASSPR